MPKFTDLTDRTFGSWLVVGRAENNKHGSARWNCRCECGRETIVEGHSLRSGISTSCGCARELDLVGQKFNRLTVLSRYPENTKTHKSQWVCRCDCGRETIVVGSHLLNGNTKSCGCRHLEACGENGKKNTLPAIEGALGYLYDNYRSRARRRGLSFLLSKKEFLALASSNCHYCGCQPYRIVYSRRAKSQYLLNGIDRMRNDIGYESGNCLPCCTPCNYAKKMMSYSEFLDWIERIAMHYNDQHSYATQAISA